MRMEKFLFTKEDYENFCARIEEIKQKIKKTTAAVGTAADSSGDQWHDSILYQTQRMSESWSREFRRLLDIQKKARIVDTVPPRDGKVRFGKTVTILDIDTGETFSYEISSYIIAAERFIKNKNNIKRISYISPLGQLLIGAQVGDIKKGSVGDTQKNFKILKVEEPSGAAESI